MSKKKKETVTKKKSYHVLVLDKSGSMNKTKEAAITGFNEKVQQLKEDAIKYKDTMDIFCSLVTFNGSVYEHLWNVPAEQLAEATADDYFPNGGTAMVDAVGYVTQKLLDTTDANDVNNVYVVETISDGDTNEDKHYTWSLLKELTEGCEATKRWTFAYMGCDKAKLEQLAARIGARASNMATWSNSTTKGAATGMGNLRSRQAKYYAEVAMGAAASSNYASDSIGVADFASCDEVLLCAPAPVIQDVANAPKIDVAAVSERAPKYVKNAWPELSNKYTGGSLFANSNRVEWEPQQADNALLEMAGISSFSNCNRPVVPAKLVDSPKVS